ncbi:MAG: diaminopimelate epimerase [Chitinophagaceae bacterium]|nr:diaminopimelate epimerase [Chitinophagaceae bacterium]
MKLDFYKYQGTGNDFVLLDNRDGRYASLSREQIAQICHRRFGIGADGLMLLNPNDEGDFEMKYYNSDGGESTMCGNGGRCIVAFAHDLGIIGDQCRFLAIDGWHDALLQNNAEIELQMNDVQDILSKETFFQLNTGSPHYVHFMEDIDDLDVKKEGALIRYSPLFKEEGINVNFVEQTEPGRLKVRTYERGVEDETWSCGTGVTASAIASVYNLPGKFHVKVSTPGGELTVKCSSEDGLHFQDVWLCGPARFVFQGEYNV